MFFHALNVFFCIQNASSMIKNTFKEKQIFDKFTLIFIDFVVFFRQLPEDTCS